MLGSSIVLTKCIPSNVVYFPCVDFLHRIQPDRNRNRNSICFVLLEFNESANTNCLNKIHLPEKFQFRLKQKNRSNEWVALNQFASDEWLLLHQFLCSLRFSFEINLNWKIWFTRHIICGFNWKRFMHPFVSSNFSIYFTTNAAPVHTLIHTQHYQHAIKLFKSK